MKILFHVEGNTDIRFVVGLAKLGELTLAVPERTFTRSGLKQRIEQEGISIAIDPIPGGRLRFQWNSLRYLLRRAKDFDVILSQEVLRGSFNATIAGALRRVPVITYMGIAPVEYFLCRRERRQISALKSWLGAVTIRFLMTWNGKLATTCLAMGPYLRDIASHYCSRSEVGLYYGVDTHHFRPANERQRNDLKRDLGLPEGFLVLFSSRMSHEKDPETVLKGCELARGRGVPLQVLNMGGGYQEFLDLAKTMGLKNWNEWVLGRPAVNPIHEVHHYFRAADAAVLASLAEGAAFSTLESLSCACPTLVSKVGGMAVQLDGYAQFFARQSAQELADRLEWIYRNRNEAVAQAKKGRQYIEQQWNSELAFQRLEDTLLRAQGIEPTRRQFRVVE